MDDSDKNMILAFGVGSVATAVVLGAMVFLKDRGGFGALSQDEYITAVMSRLPDIDPKEIKYVLMCCEQCQREGFSIEDAARYCRCTEHVNPDLDEDIALARMAKIRSKYITPEGVRKST